MTSSWLSLVPPLFVLAIGFWTHNVRRALIVGILVASAIATKFSPIHTITMPLKKMWINLELYNLMSWSTFWSSWNLFVLAFLFILGIIVVLISHSGGAYACGNTARKYIKDARGAETTSIFLSPFFFIDDYFSSLTVGSVMRPLTDSFKIPRVKLAYLVDTMAAPIAVLCPASSWVATIVGSLRENGVSIINEPKTLILADAFSVYAHLLPFLLYPFLIIISTLYIVRRRISFGSMKKHEDIAQQTGNLSGGKKDLGDTVREVADHHKESAVVWDFIAPVGMLFTSVIIGMTYSGDAALFGGTRTFVASLQHANAAITLFIGGILALIGCTLYFIARDQLHVREIPGVYWEGIELMYSAVIVLILAWSLGDILRDDLQTGKYLASLLVSVVPLFLVPALFFAISLLTSIAIGSAWGTIAIFLPLAIPMLMSLTQVTTPAPVEAVPLLFPMLAAIFSGAVAGGHFTPTSDTSIMSSTSTSTHHIDHVQTQMAYCIPVLIATICGYITSGIIITAYGVSGAALGSLIVGIVLNIGILEFLNQR